MACFLICSFWTAVSFAFPANVEVFGKVPLGEQPKIVVTVTESAQSATFTLKREDGREYSYTWGNVTAGQVKEVMLDGRAGKHEYKGSLKALVEGEPVESPVHFATVVAPPLMIKIDRKQLDLEQRRLSLTTSRAVRALSLKVIAVDESVLASEEILIKDWRRDGPIVVSWPPIDTSRLLRLELRVEDDDGFFNAVALTPWSVEIPHEEVLFASGSSDISDSEFPKLEASLEEITSAIERFSQIKGVQLFIAGHTDTVGGAAFNQNLSRKRAQAIAAWFVTKQLPVRVSFEGFGEATPKVKTNDEVDEPRNRRVDYILSVEAPQLKGAHRWTRAN